MQNIRIERPAGHTSNTYLKKLSLQVRNACNSRKVDQHNIPRSRPNRVDTKIQIKINLTYKLRNACNSVTLTNRINLLKIETE